MAIGKVSKYDKYVEVQNQTKRQEVETQDTKSSGELCNGINDKKEELSKTSSQDQGNSKEVESTTRELKNNGATEEDKLSEKIIKAPEIFNGILNIKSDTDILWDEICNGVNGKNSGIPMGFNRLDKFLSLRKSIYTLVGAGSGVGKTSIVDCAYVLNPYDWYQKNKHVSKLKLEVIYFSMERKKTYKLAKWLCKKIWEEKHILITVDEILSWQVTLDKNKQEIAKFYIDTYFKEMLESGVVTILDGAMNPTGIYKYLYKNAKIKGSEIDINEYEKRYIPNDDNLITNVIIDHLGKTKLENIGGKYDKKLTIDKLSEYLSWSRDYLHYSPVVISQFNRVSYQDIQQAKKMGLEPDPTPEYFKDSANSYEDCDVCFALFNPYKYKLMDYMDYNIQNFVDMQGNNRFRSLKILKNSYGADDVRIGLGFLGEVSLFKEVPKSSIISQYDYDNVINNKYFM